MAERQYKAARFKTDGAGIMGNGRLTMHAYERIKDETCLYGPVYKGTFKGAAKVAGLPLGLQSDVRTTHLRKAFVHADELDLDEYMMAHRSGSIDTASSEIPGGVVWLSIMLCRLPSGKYMMSRVY